METFTLTLYFHSPAARDNTVATREISPYIPSNTFTPVEERVLNRIKFYPRLLDFMMIKSLP